MDLDRLEALKRSFGGEEQTALPRLMRQLGRTRFTDAGSLIRFHEALLFFRAYPPNVEVLALADELLQLFPKKIERLRRADVDLTPFEEPDVSGIAGTALSALFTYEITRWLAERHPEAVEIDWDGYDAALLAPLLNRLHPFADEDLLVEANIPYMDWFRAAKRGGGSDLRWLLSQIDSAELWAQAKLFVRWQLGDGRATRTNGRLPGRRKPFFHDAPLIRRADVSLARELQSPKLPIEKLGVGEGEKILDFARETSAMRYRELHGFTFGDPAHVYRAEFGRGVEAYVFGVPPEHRLPLRAYHAGMFFKNGVPIGYIECLTLFEHMEVGFNLYYTFREGETAWLYAKLLRLFHQLTGATCFAVDPYQIGHHNEEAIESGAFWFYRKLGFRPANPKVAKLLQTEESKMRADPGHRTSARTLERMAEGWMLYEIPGSAARRLGSLRDAPRSDGAAAVSVPAGDSTREKRPEESTYVRALLDAPALRRRILKLGSALG